MRLSRIDALYCYLLTSPTHLLCSLSAAERASLLTELFPEGVADVPEARQQDEIMLHFNRSTMSALQTRNAALLQVRITCKFRPALR